MQNLGIAQFIKENVKNTKFYKTHVNDIVIVSCFGEEKYGELSKFANLKLNADLLLLVNLPKKSVKLLNLTKKNFNFIKFASILELTGDEHSAEGSVNKKLLLFTKKLVPCT